MKPSFFFVVAIVAGAAAGCTEPLVCSEGTHLEGNECRASLSPACGPGTRLETGLCVPDQGGGATCGTGTHLEANICIADVALGGNAARFYEVALTAPAIYVNLANAQLGESFRSGENLLFVGVYEPNQADLRVFGGNGTRSGATYLLDRTRSYDSPIAFVGEKFSTQPFTLALYAFGASQPIMLVDTVMSDATTTSVDGVTMVQAGKVSGVLTPQAADAVYIEQANQTLLQLNRSLRVTPDVDHDGDRTPESWTMALQFTTVPVWLF